MYKPRLLSLLIVMAFAAPASLLAGPANPALVTLVQPDGTSFQARPFGDEWYNGMETADGYTILRDERTGWWEYAAQRSGGGLESSSERVGLRVPVDFPLHLRDADELARAERERTPAGGRALRAASDAALPEWYRSTGKHRVLYILVQFADQKLVQSDAAEWNKLVFKGSKSVAGYFKEVSYKKLKLKPAKETHGKKNDGIVIVTLPQNHPGVAGGTSFSRDIAVKALRAADPFVKFASFEKHFSASLQSDELSIVFILAGYENGFAGAASKMPSVWGHATSLTDAQAPTLDGVIVGAFSQFGGYSMFGEHHARVDATRNVGNTATIGIQAHELGHAFGDLPDLYDTDGTSDGIGNWGVMGGGNWLGGTLAGDTPCHPSPWAKAWLRWITPTPVTSNKTISVGQAATSKNGFYRLGDNPDGTEWSGGKGEYFLIENRQRTGYDKFVPGIGLLIWHIDESRGDNRQEKGNKKKHRLVDVEEADGKKDLDKVGFRGDAGDTYPGSTNNRTFDGNSKPDSKYYNKKASGFSVTEISEPGATMTARIKT